MATLYSFPIMTQDSEEVLPRALTPVSCAYMCKSATGMSTITPNVHSNQDPRVDQVAYHAITDVCKNNSDISYLKTGQAFEHFDPLKSSPASHSLLVSGSICIMSSCSLPVFLLLVSLTSSHLCCLCFSVSISNS